MFTSHSTQSATDQRENEADLRKFIQAISGRSTNAAARALEVSDKFERVSGELSSLTDRTQKLHQQFKEQQNKMCQLKRHRQGA